MLNCSVFIVLGTPMTLALDSNALKEILMWKVVSELILNHHV